MMLSLLYCLQTLLETEWEEMHSPGFMFHKKLKASPRPD